MKRMTQQAFDRAVREGRIESMSDVSRSGYVDIRRASGKRETIQIINRPQA